MSYDSQFPTPCRRLLITGFVALVALVAGFGIWVMRAQLNGAIIASGYVDFLAPRTAIQHKTGGSITALFVQDGQSVSAGDILLRFDAAEVSARLREIELQYSELSARRDQTRSELLGQETISFLPWTQRVLLGDDDVRKVQENQKKLHQERRALLRNRIGSLETQKDRIRSQIIGLRIQKDSIEKQRRILDEQETELGYLHDRGLALSNQVAALQTDQARMQGQFGKLLADIAAAEIRIAETDLKIAQARSTAKEATLARLRDLEFRLAEMAQKHATIVSDLQELTVKAPMNGVVSVPHGLGVGQIVDGSDTLLTLLPGPDDLTIKVALPVENRAFVHPQQNVRLKIRLPDHATPTEFKGFVKSIGPEALLENATGRTKYPVTITLFERSQSLKGLAAGMPAEVFIETGDMPVWQYLVGPLDTYFSRALSEG